ncbi:RNI-like protein [Fomes fomentarius]|nr:RNI-like protein [Fomes fomentarius]
MEHAYIDELPSDEESCFYAEHLVFHPDPDPDPDFPPEYIDDELAEVLPYCPNITSAYLSGIPDLSSRTLILLAENAPDLTYLDISGCAEVTDLGLSSVATHSTSLTSLFISRIPGVTDRGLAALVRGLPHLEDLEIDNLSLITAVSLRDVWTFARGLKHWTLSGCMNITDAGFPWVPGTTQLQTNQERDDRRRTWMENLPPLVLPGTHTLDNLRILDLSHCVRLTDAAILGVVAHAPRINQLNIAGCIELTDRALQALCALGRHLRILDVAGLERVTDKGVFAVISECRRLRSVDVSCLTDLVVLELASLPRLERLAAAGLPRLTDHAAFFLAEHAFELEQLHLSYCVRLSLDGVRAMLRRLTKLERLSLTGVPAMRRRGVRRFSERPPESHEEGKQGLYREFRGGNIRGLGEFLDKEEWRKREAERLNVLFEPRGDDSRELY